MKRKKMAPRREKKKRNEKKRGGKSVGAPTRTRDAKTIKEVPACWTNVWSVFRKGGAGIYINLKKKLKLRWGQGPPSPLAPPLVGNFLNEILTT